MSGFTAPRLISTPDHEYEAIASGLKALREGQVQAVGAVLWEHYPGHPWHVEVVPDGSAVKVQLRGLMGPTNWYVIHTVSLKGELGRHKVKRAGGELLERFRMPRLGFSLDDFRAAMAAVPAHRKFHGYVPE